LAKLLSVTRY